MSNITRQLVGQGPDGADIYVDPEGILAVYNDKDRLKKLETLRKAIQDYQEFAGLEQGMMGKLTMLQENKDLQAQYVKLHLGLSGYSGAHHDDHSQFADLLGIAGTYYQQADQG